MIVIYAPREVDMVVRAKQARQLELELPTWGGRRAGAGRKRIAARSSVPHRARVRMRADWPVHVTLRVRDDVPDLRRRDAWSAIVRVLRALRGRLGISVVHYSVLVNHIHLIAEVDDGNVLASGMQRLCAALAKAINGTLGRTGTVFASRYHARPLKTPTEVRNALRYVLLNARHHAEEAGISLPRLHIDDRSTAATFDGWREAPRLRERSADFGTSPARTWLLRVGWKRLGLLDLDDAPGCSKRVPAPAT